MSIARAYWLLLATLLLTLAGCDNGLNLKNVTGTVTKDGTPFVGALVEFYPAGDAAPSYGKTDDEGNFRLYYSTGSEGAFVGEHKVHIIGGRKKGDTSPPPPVPTPPPPPAEEVAALPEGEAAPVPIAAPGAPAPGAPAPSSNLLPGMQGPPLSATVTASGPNHIELKL